MGIVGAIVAVYLVCVQMVKRRFVKKYGYE
jgi:hypothetical protein